MVLNFVKDGSKYVAEFEAIGDFNLHIERKESGFLFVNQRTTQDGEWDSVKGASYNYYDPVVDVDFTSVVYPKWVQVVSKVEPIRAEVNFAKSTEDYMDDMIANALNTPI